MCEHYCPLCHTEWDCDVEEECDAKHEKICPVCTFLFSIGEQERGDEYD